MKKKILNFNFCKNKEAIEKGLQELAPIPQEPVVDNDPKQALLEVIYQVGSNGYPVGDLAMYASSQASPEVRRFILDNLLLDVSGNANPSSVNLDDDTITVLTRQAGESMQSYAARLNKSIETDKFIIQKTIENAKRPVQPVQAAEPPAE